MVVTSSDPQQRCQPSRSSMNLWIYFFGEVQGEDIKIGHSTGETLRQRLKDVNDQQTTNAEYQLLAGVRGDGKDEKAAQDYFGALQRPDKGKRKEYFWPEPELVEYVNWLRQWWWVALDIDEKRDDTLATFPDMWLPGPERRLPAPPSEDGMLIQRFQNLEGPLAGTPWDWFIFPKASVKDYFTPPEIVEAARQAMGGIDLDAASHPIANREHQIPDYFHVNRSAFEHNWYGRVWLNPPYSKNAPWFDRMMFFLESGQVEQLCMLSPIWVFTTAQAKPVMQLCKAAVLLVPTPKFWGNEANKTGTNLTHAVVYFGDRVAEFVTAFAPYGIPVEVAWDRVLELIPDAEEAVAA